ncbi:MAG: PRTRC system protein C [Candidatus Manganitrophaceae bacterium]|nr:MAG: PRTRC system protein C [Candidatus Manganitrophaceae bacterium]
MDVQIVKRCFRYSALELPDPDPAMSPERVKEFYAAVYPELTQAVVEEPERKGATQIYKFTRAVGTKGGEQSPPHLLTIEQLAELSEEALEEEKGGACPHDILTRFLGTIRRDSDRNESPLPGRFLSLLP